MGDSTKCQSEVFLSLNVSNSRKFCLNKVQGQNSFLKKMKTIIRFSQRNFNFKAINNLPRLIIFLKRDNDESQLLRKFTKRRVYDFPIMALRRVFFFFFGYFFNAKLYLM